MYPIKTNAIEAIEKTVRCAFLAVREEMDDHRDAINANTNELQQNYEYMMQIESKIEKLSERIDEIFLMMQGGAKRIMLSKEEQSVFLHLYTLEDFGNIDDIAKKLCMTVSAVDECIRGMVSKGVDLTTSYRDRTCFVRLDPEFRESHARNSVVEITVQ